MWHARMDAEWDRVSWLAAATRNIHLKTPQKADDINPWKRKPRERTPFALGSIELLNAQMRAER